RVGVRGLRDAGLRRTSPPGRRFAPATLPIKGREEAWRRPSHFGSTPPSPRMPTKPKSIAKVLVIKLGGVGEWVMAFPAFERIRQAHPKAKITLLTTQPFAALAASSPFFNHVDADGAPKDPASWTALILRIRKAAYDRVYDL